MPVPVLSARKTMLPPPPLASMTALPWNWTLRKALKVKVVELLQLPMAIPSCRMMSPLPLTPGPQATAVQETFCPVLMVTFEVSSAWVIWSYPMS